jgi:hypothetical protein
MSEEVHAGVMIGAASHLSWEDNGYNPKSNRYSGGTGQNHLVGRNVQKNERRTALCTGYKLQVNPEGGDFRTRSLGEWETPVAGRNVQRDEQFAGICGWR